MIGKGWILDGTYSTDEGLWCFCPIETGRIIFGLNFLSMSLPGDGGEFLGVWHADGPEAAAAWVARNKDALVAADLRPIVYSLS